MIRHALSFELAFQHATPFGLRLSARSGFASACQHVALRATSQHWLLDGGVPAVKRNPTVVNGSVFVVRSRRTHPLLTG